MKWGEAEIWLQQQLSSGYGDREAAAMTNLVMEKICGADRTTRAAKREEALGSSQIDELKQVAKRLSAHEPVQYVLGQAWFFDLPFYVDKSVLIPRPETEELVKWVLDDVKASGANVFEKGVTDADLTRTLKILDAGSGSGCIALALKKNLPRAEVWGCDVSEEALNVSRRNGSELNIRVDFQGINFLDVDQQKGLPSVDIVVSNPPYIPQSGASEMHSNVKDHEPHIALFVPDEDPFVFYRALAAFGKHRLHPGGSIYCEIHEGKGEGVKEVFLKQSYSDVVVKKDMQGKERMVRVRK